MDFAGLMQVVEGVEEFATNDSDLGFVEIA
jgi:hypothetical protein